MAGVRYIMDFKKKRLGQLAGAVNQDISYRRHVTKRDVLLFATIF